MSSKSRSQQKSSNTSKSYEECLKQGIPIGKIYGSDFTDGFIVKRYPYPPYPWNNSLLPSSSNKVDKQRTSQKSTRTSQKKVKRVSRKVKSKSLQRSKSKPKSKQRSKSRKR